MSFKTDWKTTPMEGRFAWCYLDMPRTHDMNQKQLDVPKYECSFYFPKTAQVAVPVADQAHVWDAWGKCRNYAFFAQIAWEVVQGAYRGQWPMIGGGGSWTDWPIDDCDQPSIADKQPWARGMWRAGLSGGKFRPGVFDAGNNPIEPAPDGKFRPGAFKGSDGTGGDWGFASVNAYEWSFGSRRGVSFGLEAIKKTRDDEAVGGGRRPVEQIFGAPTGQPVHGGAPPAPGSGHAPSLPGPYAAPVAQQPAPQSYGYPPGASSAQQPAPHPTQSPGSFAPPPGGPYGVPPTPQPYPSAQQGGGMPPPPPQMGVR